MNNSAVNIINQIIAIFGFPTIVAGLIYIGRKLQILDDLKKKSEGIEDFSKCATNAIVELAGIILRDKVMKEVKFDDKY